MHTSIYSTPANNSSPVRVSIYSHREMSWASFASVNVSIILRKQVDIVEDNTVKSILRSIHSQEEGSIHEHTFIECKVPLL